jgi:ACS family hexuronate transporter-like MFS transporter
MPNAFILASCVAFAQQGWSMLSMALAFSYFSPEAVGTAWGVASAGSGLGGFLSTSLIGRCVTRLSYTPVFCGLAVLHPLALVLLWAIRSSRASTVQDPALQSVQG